MAENIYDNVGQHDCHYLRWVAIRVILPTLVSYMTTNNEIEGCSTILGVLEKIDLQMKAF